MTKNSYIYVTKDISKIELFDTLCKLIYKFQWYFILFETWIDTNPARLKFNT